MSDDVRKRWLCVLTSVVWDVAVGVMLAALLVATLLFSSGASRFVYIDF